MSSPARVTPWRNAHDKSYDTQGRVDAMQGMFSSTVFTPSPNSGWAEGSADGLCQSVSVWIGMDGLVHMQGTIHSTSASPNANFFTIPAAYRPASKNVRLPIIEATSSAAFPNFIGIATSGVCSPFIVTSASGTDYHIDIRYRQ